MFEALVGLLFAFFFVMIYLLISLYRKQRLEGRGHWHELYPPSLDGPQANNKFFLPGQEMSRHHLPAAAQSPRTDTSETATQGQR